MDNVFEQVKHVVVSTLGIEDREAALTPATPLLGSIPELDSMAVVELLTALSEEFGIELDDSEITADVFETLGDLTKFVESDRS